MATAARPILASTLFDATHPPLSTPERLTGASSKRQSDSSCDYTRKKRAKVRTNHKSVDDDVLDGGFDVGEGEGAGAGAGAGAGGIVGGIVGGTVGVACEEARGVVELAYSTLTSHLLDHADSRAFYIDTSRTFDPKRLHETLTSRLKTQSSRPVHDGGYVYYQRHDSRPNENATEDDDKRAMKALDRISVMRVFDVEGLMDAVMEIKATLITLERASDPTISLQPTRDTKQAHSEHTSRDSVAHVRNEIADSQASDDDLELTGQNSTVIDQREEDSDMLLEALKADDTAKPPEHKDDSNQRERHQYEMPGPYLIVIPSPARIISPAMHTNHVRTHALLVHLMRTLQQLIQTYLVCTLFLNTTVEQDSKAPTNQDDSPSAFNANAKVKPALGRTFDWSLDFSCMVTSPFRDPKNTDQAGNGTKKHVFEVLHDRTGRRTGRWALLDI